VKVASFNQLQNERHGDKHLGEGREVKPVIFVQEPWLGREFGMPGY
jgi:hypothetical protein